MIFAQLTGRGGEYDLCCYFLKNGKILLIFKKMSCVHLRVKLLIRNVVLRVTRGKKLRHFFLKGLSCVADEMFVEVPLFQETSPALKNSWFRPFIFLVVSEIDLKHSKM